MNRLIQCMPAFLHCINTDDLHHRRCLPRCSLFPDNMASQQLDISPTKEQPSARQVPHAVQDHGDVKQVKVHSIELADALAKDQPNFKSASMMKLYALMLFATLSTLCTGRAMKTC